MNYLQCPCRVEDARGHVVACKRQGMLSGLKGACLVKKKRTGDQHTFIRSHHANLVRLNSTSQKRCHYLLTVCCLCSVQERCTRPYVTFLISCKVVACSLRTCNLFCTHTCVKHHRFLRIRPREVYSFVLPLAGSDSVLKGTFIEGVAREGT